MVLWAFCHVGAAAVFMPQGAREWVPMAYRQIRRGKGKGTGTNVHFEETHNEHTVASSALLSLTQRLNASLYLALRRCRLSIAPLRQSSFTLNNVTLIFLAGCSLLLCDYWAHPFICRHISLDEVRINALLVFPSRVRCQAANEKRWLVTAEAFCKDWKCHKILL